MEEQIKLNKQKQTNQGFLILDYVFTIVLKYVPNYF